MNFLNYVFLEFFQDFLTIRPQICPEISQNFSVLTRIETGMKLEKVERSPVLDKVFRAISYLKILQDFCHEFLKLFYLYLFTYLFIL